MDQDLFHIFMDFIYNFFENIILLQNLVPTVCLSAAIGYIFYWIFMKDYNFAEVFKFKIGKIVTLKVNFIHRTLLLTDLNILIKMD